LYCKLFLAFFSFCVFKTKNHAWDFKASNRRSFYNSFYYLEPSKYQNQLLLKPKCHIMRVRKVPKSVTYYLNGPKWKIDLCSLKKAMYNFPQFWHQFKCFHFFHFIWMNVISLFLEYFKPKQYYRKICFDL